MSVSSRVVPFSNSNGEMAQSPLCISRNDLMIAAERKYRLTTGWRHLLTYLMFLCLYVAILGTQRSVSDGHGVQEALQNAFVDQEWSSSPPKSFFDIGTRSDLDTWFTQVFASIFPANTGDPFVVQDYNMIVGSAIISIQVLKGGTCDTASSYSSVYPANLCFGGVIQGYLDDSCINSKPNQVIATLFCGEYESTFNGNIFLFSSTLNSSAASELLSSLRNDRNWVTSTNVSQLTLTMLYYNGRVEQFSEVEIGVAFENTGWARPWVKFTILDIENYHSKLDIARAVGEAFFCLGLLFDIVVELREIVRFWKRKQIRVYLTSWWNVIDWLNFALIITAISLWIGIQTKASTVQLQSTYVNGGTASINSDLLSLLNKLQGIVSLQQVYININSVACIVLLLRIIKVMNFQPQMALLTNTLITAASLLLHFLMLFAVVFFGFAFVAYFAFGTRILAFKTMWESILSLFSLLQGGLDWNELMDAQEIIGPIFLFTFCIIITYLLMQMLMAIILDTFSDVKDESNLRESAFSELRSGFTHVMRLARKNDYRTAAMKAPSHKVVLQWLEGVETSEISQKQFADKFNLDEVTAGIVLQMYAHMIEEFDKRSNGPKVKKSMNSVVESIVGTTRTPPLIAAATTTTTTTTINEHGDGDGGGNHNNNNDIRLRVIEEKLDLLISKL